MVERTEPFKCVAFDLVGPLSKAKGGFLYILTYVCMSSRWPEAVALKSITARSVAETMIELFSRTALPIKLLTDRGSQFTGILMNTLCEILAIERIKTTQYHPQSNGTIERMHGMLEAMLTKARAKGMDWPRQIPLALFAPFGRLHINILG